MKTPMLQSRDDRIDTVSGKGFRWKCPICGTSRINKLDEGPKRQNAIIALKSHIVAADGDGHGPRNEFPADIDTQALPEHVIKVDGSGNPVEIE